MTPVQVQRGLFITAALSAAHHAREQGAPIAPTIAAAQAALESRYGESRLAVEASNLFGVKAGRRWTGEVLELPTMEWDRQAEGGHGGWVKAMARWRKYPDWTACFADYGRIIGSLSWFADAAAAARRGDARGFLEGLIAKPNGPGIADDEPGWATDPLYSGKVLSVALQWGLLA